LPVIERAMVDGMLIDSSMPCNSDFDCTNSWANAEGVSIEGMSPFSCLGSFKCDKDINYILVQNLMVASGWQVLRTSDNVRSLLASANIQEKRFLTFLMRLILPSYTYNFRISAH